MGAILRSSAVRTELQALLNGFAEQGAERAASVVAEAIRSMTIADAAAIVRGGSTAATDYLRGSMRTSLIDVMVPEIGMVMRSAESGLLSQVVRAATGYDLNALAGDLSSGAEAAIWRSIGAEEANIRANPQQTNNPLLIGIFGLR